jgi:hypothetical protein
MQKYQINVQRYTHKKAKNANKQHNNKNNNNYYYYYYYYYYYCCCCCWYNEIRTGTRKPYHGKRNSSFEIASN